jgi:hypothetical protein
MKTLYVLAASTLALTTAACGPQVPKARAALECPAKQGDLTRTSTAPDGKTCTYASGDGAEVTLQLVSVQSGVDATLSNIETILLAGRMKPEEKAAADAAKAKLAGEAAPGSAAETKSAASAAEQAAREAAADTNAPSLDLKVNGKDVDGVTVEMKAGKPVVTDSESAVTRVDLPGIHIVANDNDDTAKVQVGPIKIDAGGDAATIRIRRDVRLRGEALNPERRGLRATFIYTGEDLVGGYRFVGYEAGGPKRGPITVAVVKSKAENMDEDELHRDVKRLVRKNGGV